MPSPLVEKRHSEFDRCVLAVQVHGDAPPDRVPELAVLDVGLLGRLLRGDGGREEVTHRYRLQDPLELRDALGVSSPPTGACVDDLFCELLGLWLVALLVTHPDQHVRIHRDDRRVLVVLVQLEPLVAPERTELPAREVPVEFVRVDRALEYRVAGSLVPALPTLDGGVEILREQACELERTEHALAKLVVPLLREPACAVLERRGAQYQRLVAGSPAREHDRCDQPLLASSRGPTTRPETACKRRHTERCTAVQYRTP